MKTVISHRDPEVPQSLLLLSLNSSVPLRFIKTSKL